MSNYPCKSCSKQVRSRRHAFQCKLCNHWIHKKCNKLNEIDYNRLQTSSTTWYCIICLSEIFPFTALTDNELSLHLSIHKNVNFDDLAPKLNLFPNANKTSLFRDLNNFISSQKNDYEDNNDNLHP